MRRDNISTAAYWLALFLGVAYAAGGIIGWIADVTDGDGSDLAFWLVFLPGGAALILAGLFGTPRWRWISVLLISLGAAAGALALFWTIIVPILVLALIALAFTLARRGTVTA
jgi:hypothetical protein